MGQLTQNKNPNVTPNEGVAVPAGKSEARVKDLSLPPKPGLDLNSFDQQTRQVLQGQETLSFDRSSENAPRGYGSHGAGVQTMQAMVETLGFSVGKYGLDGRLGQDTEKAVMAFQEKFKNKYNLSSTNGVVDKATMTAIISEYQQKTGHNALPDLDKAVATSRGSMKVADFSYSSKGTDKKFDQAFAMTLAHEGLTDALSGTGDKYGISPGALRKHLVQNSMPLRPVTSLNKHRQADRDLIANIYKTDYYDASGAAHLPKGPASFHFDTAVNMGNTAAVKMLQRALGVNADGKMGANTLAAIDKADPEMLLASYKALREERYQNIAEKQPSKAKYLKGWLKRNEKAYQAAINSADKGSLG